MRRLFWLGLGLGAGTAGAVAASRFAKRQARKVAPSAIAREARVGLMDLSKLVSESLDEGKRAMRARETELRERQGDPGRGVPRMGPDEGRAASGADRSAP